VARKDTSVARAKDPNEKNDRRASRKKPSTPITAPPPNLTLIVHPGSGPRRTSPTGEETQGPSPVDYSFELEAKFSNEMVIEMQGNAAKKARRIVIGRMLGRRATFKVLHECLKLHLPATFVSATLFTRGFFLILFENEEGTTSTRKLASVEWNGISLSFLRYNPNFDASAQGAKALLTHIIKVQFPNLHEQFRNEKAFNIMASKLGEVLNIEAADSYMKSLAGPMVTIQVRDIAKLAGYIRIPSMAEEAATTDMIHQRILYSGLSNQCRKCRRFGHQARTCNTIKSKTQEGVVQHNSFPSTTDGRQPSTRQAPTNATHERAQGPTSTTAPNPQVLGKYQGHMEAKIPWNRTLAPPLPTDPSWNHSGSHAFDPSQWNVTTGAHEDLSMTEPPPSPSRAKGETRAETEKLPEDATTPKNKLFFGLRELNSPSAQKTKASANPFPNLDEGSRGVDLRARPQEDTLEGWSFQGRRKHAPKLASPKSETHHTLPALLSKKQCWGEKECSSIQRYTLPISLHLT